MHIDQIDQFRNARFEEFLAERGLVLLRRERITGERSKVVVQHDGHSIAVSYQGDHPTRWALQKLDHAIGERTL
jgi:hypothetical protein